MKILETFKEECAARYGILTLGIFGSVARDDTKEASDIDVVLRTKTPDPYNIVLRYSHLSRPTIASFSMARQCWFCERQKVKAVKYE